MAAPIVLHFEALGSRRRAVVTADRTVIERLDGADALGVERWQPCDFTNHDGDVSLSTFEDVVDAAIRAALDMGELHAAFAGVSALNVEAPPLPDGWSWRIEDGVIGACSHGFDVWITNTSDALDFSHGHDRAPLAVVEAVIARHRAGKAGA